MYVEKNFEANKASETLRSMIALPWPLPYLIGLFVQTKAMDAIPNEC